MWPSYQATWQSECQDEAVIADTWVNVIRGELSPPVDTGQCSHMLEGKELTIKFENQWKWQPVSTKTL